MCCIEVVFSIRMVLCLWLVSYTSVVAPVGDSSSMWCVQHEEMDKHFFLLDSLPEMYT